MLKSERENKILKYLEQNGYSSVKDLSAMLFTSESSIRRDLTHLEDAGLIKRSYGGAEILSANKFVLPFSTRAYDNIREKRIIAQKASKLIGEGAVIFIDSSSTGYFLALDLMDRADITVVTNNIEIIELLSNGKPTVHSTGGILSRDNRTCLVGRNAENSFEEINADIGFFSAKALGLDGVISDCTQEEVFVRKSLLRNSDKKVALFDKYKIGKTSSFKQCSLRDIDILISDETDAISRFKEMCEIM